MIIAVESDWTKIEPDLKSKYSRDAFVSYARVLSRAVRADARESAVEDARDAFVEATTAARRIDNQALLASGLVLTDLVIQGWGLRVRGDLVAVRPPSPVTSDRDAEKARIRKQELVKRDAQLVRPSVQKFIRSMERTRSHNGAFVSIFSLMRDGRDLAEKLNKARAHLTNGWMQCLAEAIDPYLQFVDTREATCSFTGLRLMDIWRYFRHTWTNQYTNVPGRTMLFLVRDRAAMNHPIIGIGALNSPVMQIRERDAWIGWHPDVFLERIRSAPTLEIARWLVGVVDDAINEIYVADLLEDNVISARSLRNPTEEVIERLIEEASTQRRRHHRYARSRDYRRKRSDIVDDGYWVTRARTHLFRSKRALALATYLRVRKTFQQAFDTRPTRDKLSGLAKTAQGSDAIRRVLKKAKGDRVGIAVADIAVCGAVQPYNAVLGGKLVAMLAASPEVVVEYRRRYSSAESEIASSMAGRAVVRPANLVFLGTTSLYGIGSSQYNRIKIPCERIDGLPGEVICYKELGRSEAYGTSHYSDETVQALVDVVQQADAQRVNSIFGEGGSPKLRKVRQALDMLNLPSSLLLRHHRPRVIYGVSLVRNLCETLLGLASKPRYLMSLDDSRASTAKISEWWRERWLRNRIRSDDVLGQVARHSLVHPIAHGARVIAPNSNGQEDFFIDGP
ncbi:DUF4338 domain-containing protein [Steroidobacter sp. S1-65]|uniref:DUF4338 domain-containing protein n=1 Tax=Steroidobacter gossypii TaxID=2805490 RepID=A0ABS1X1J6_9GAMM|nr:Druantia anti-phage system protein DruA [Steroidobacter gossypii]MBM0107123.1 DUF4338 domain-containing protein [Steroidobacter gossypii]